eukprot:9692190-Alexandrium_andersonii.AAC.1
MYGSLSVDSARQLLRKRDSEIAGLKTQIVALHQKVRRAEARLQHAKQAALEDQQPSWELQLAVSRKRGGARLTDGGALALAIRRNLAH